jgi:chromosome partitioning protein
MWAGGANFCIIVFLYNYTIKQLYMPKIITLSHQKGGVGKSTLTLNLAYSFGDNLNTAIIDLDPQGTIAQLKPIIKTVGVISDIKDIRSIQDLPYDVIFVDTPPYLSDQLPELFNISDLVIIPTKASLADLMAIRSTIAILAEAKKIKASLKTAIVFNMVKQNALITEEIKGLIDEFGTPVLSGMVTDRLSFIRSLGMNKGVYAIDDPKAKAEIDILTEQIIKLLYN